jgi:putative lipoic acid-binding regulatory protein
MQRLTPKQQEPDGSAAASQEPLYPAEVHFSVIVTEDFTGNQALADVLATRCVTRPLQAGGVSRTRKYRSFTVSVRVPSRAELEQLDRDLRGVPGVKLLL